MEYKEDVKGNVIVSEEVVSAIANLAATEVEGVAHLHQGITGGIAERLGKKNNSKGVRVVKSGDELIIDLFVDVDFGVQVQETAQKVQRKVKTTVEAMTGTRVIQVNVNVDGVRMKHATD